jgi:hypothetical protein
MYLTLTRKKLSQYNKNLILDSLAEMKNLKELLTGSFQKKYSLPDDKITTGLMYKR